MLNYADPKALQVGQRYHVVHKDLGIDFEATFLGYSYYNSASIRKAGPFPLSGPATNQIDPDLVEAMDWSANGSCGPLTAAWEITAI